MVINHVLDKNEFYNDTRILRHNDTRMPAKIMSDRVFISKPFVLFLFLFFYET